MGKMEKELNGPRCKLTAKFNKLPIPSLEKLCEEMASNPWLAAVVRRVTQHKSWGDREANIFTESFTDNCLDVDQEGEFDHYSLDQSHAIVPYLRRLGYGVTLYSEGMFPMVDDLPFSIRTKFSFHPGHLQEFKTALTEHKNHGTPYFATLRGNSPRQIRGRGLVKCVPKLLGWLRQARITLADPSRPGAMDTLEAERAKELTDTTPPHWETAATEQSRRKRKLVDAIHADEDDVANGARWANINAHGKAKLCRTTGAPFVRPMRIEAIADDHFIFQRSERDNFYDVVVLHRDAFDVAPWPEQGFHAEGYEEEFDNRFCSTGESDEEDE